MKVLRGGGGRGRNRSKTYRQYGTSLPSKPNGSFPALDDRNHHHHTDLRFGQTAPLYEPLEQAATADPASIQPSRSWRSRVSKLNCVVCATPHPRDAASGDKRGGPHDDDGDEEATTLDHTTYDEAAPANYYHDASFFDVVAEEPEGAVAPWRGPSWQPPPSTARGADATPPRPIPPPPTARHHRRAPSDELGAAPSADSSSYYLSSERTSQSSGLPVDSMGSGASFDSADAAPERAPPASPLRRRGRSPAGDGGGGRVGIRPFVVPDDVAEAEARREAAGAGGALDREYDYFFPAEANIVLPAPEDEMAGGEGAEAKEKAKAAAVARAAAAAPSVLDQPAPSIDSSLAMYDEDLYYQRAQEILHAALVASSQQPSPRPKAAADRETEEEEDGAALPASSPPVAPTLESAANSASRKEDRSAEERPAPSGGGLAGRARGRDSADAVERGGDDGKDAGDGGPLSDDGGGAGGKYEDDDTIATEEATDHVPSPCPSDDDEAADAAPEIHPPPRPKEPAKGKGPRGEEGTAPEAPRRSAGSTVASGAAPEPTVPRRPPLSAMARSPSSGDSPVVQSSKVVAPSAFAGGDTAEGQVGSIPPEALAPALGPSAAAAATASVQETLRKLERMNVERRADRTAFESPKRERTGAGKSFEYPGPLRMTKSSDDADTSLQEKSRHAIVRRSAIADCNDGSNEEDDFPEIQKSPSSPPAFSATEAESRPLQKEDNTPPPIPRLAPTAIPRAVPPPSSMRNVRRPRASPPPPLPPPPPNTPLAHSPAASVPPSPTASVPHSPASGSASAKMKTLISKFESAPVRPSTLGARKIHPKVKTTPPVVFKPSLPDTTAMTMSTNTSSSTIAPRLRPAESSAYGAPPLCNHAAMTPSMPSQVAAARAAYTQSFPQQTTTKSTGPPPPVPAHTPESSPRSFGRSVRKVPSSRRGLQGVQAYPSPRDGLTKQHPTKNRCPPNASPPTESSRHPSLSASRTLSSSRDSSNRGMDLTPPVLTQQRRANVPITSNSTGPSTSRSSFFWRSHPASSPSGNAPELSQQPSLESLASNSEEASLASPDADKGNSGAGGARGRRLDDYEKMLQSQRQEARRRYEEAHKPPWARLS
jgi:hypothetical protein